MAKKIRLYRADCPNGVEIKEADKAFWLKSGWLSEPIKTEEPEKEEIEAEE